MGCSEMVTGPWSVDSLKVPWLLSLICSRAMLGLARLGMGFSTQVLESGWAWVHTSLNLSLHIYKMSFIIVPTSNIIKKRKTGPLSHTRHISSVQFSSVAQSCLNLCDPMDCSTPGLPVHHQLPEFTQTYVH